MSSVRSPSSGRSRVAPADLTLVNWPVRDQPVSAAVLALALLAGAAAVGWWGPHPIAGVAAAAAFWLATWRWWVPVTFVFGPAGVTQTILGRSTRQPWPTVASFDRLEYGVMLLPDTEDSTAAFRGRYVAWRDQRDALLVLLDFYIGQRGGDSRTHRSTKTR